MVRVRLTPRGRAAVDGAMGNLLERVQLAALLRTLLEGFD
jgi:hypothetical protein